MKPAGAFTTYPPSAAGHPAAPPPGDASHRLETRAQPSPGKHQNTQQPDGPRAQPGSRRPSGSTPSLAIGPPRNQFDCELTRLRHENTQLRQQLNMVRQELARQAYAARHDPLTGLPNRRLLTELQPAAAAVMIDLDGFKAVNDRIGHDAGDQVLIIVAERLVHQLGHGWLPVRLGGDEFAAIHSRELDEVTAVAGIGTLAQALAQPMRIEGRHLRIGCSIGLAIPPGLTPVRRLLRAADEAVATAKQRSTRPTKPASRGSAEARQATRVREPPCAQLDHLAAVVVVNAPDATPTREVACAPPPA